MFYFRFQASNCLLFIISCLKCFAQACVSSTTQTKLMMHLIRLDICNLIRMTNLTHHVVRKVGLVIIKLAFQIGLSQIQGNVINTLQRKLYSDSFFNK